MSAAFDWSPGGCCCETIGAFFRRELGPRKIIYGGAPWVEYFNANAPGAAQWQFTPGDLIPGTRTIVYLRSTNNFQSPPGALYAYTFNLDTLAFQLVGVEQLQFPNTWNFDRAHLVNGELVGIVHNPNNPQRRGVGVAPIDLSNITFHNGGGVELPYDQNQNTSTAPYAGITRSGWTLGYKAEVPGNASTNRPAWYDYGNFQTFLDWIPDLGIELIPLGDIADIPGGIAIARWGHHRKPPIPFVGGTPPNELLGNSSNGSILHRAAVLVYSKAGQYIRRIMFPDDVTNETTITGIDYHADTDRIFVATPQGVWVTTSSDTKFEWFMHILQMEGHGLLALPT